MGEFVDEDEPGPAFEDGVDVHFAQAMALMIDGAARNDLVTINQRFGLAAAMRLDHTDHDIDPGLAPLPPVGEHFPRLADPGGGAKKHFQTATAFLRRLAQEGLW